MSEMLPLPPFALLEPKTVAECVALLAEHGDAKLISGGTDLLPSMKYGLFSPPTLVSTQGIAALKTITDSDGEVAIGAGLTHLDLQDNALIREHYPALAVACSQVATPTLQAMGTIGGNLMLDTRCVWYNQSQFWRDSLGGCLKCEGEICHVAPKGEGCYAAHSADAVPVLMLLGAEVELVNSEGIRRVPIDTLYDSDGRGTAKASSDALLTRILLPPASGEVIYRKLRPRGSIDYPLLLTAIRIDRDATGSPTGGGVVLSALGPKPLEITGVSELIAAGDVEQVAEQAWKQALPLSTHHWASTWRKKMVRVEVRRALSELLATD